MRSAWRWRRKSLITLEEAVFKGRRICQKCGEKFLRRKAEEGGGSELAKNAPKIAETPREATAEKTAAPEVHVGDLEYYPS